MIRDELDGRRAGENVVFDGPASLALNILLRDIIFKTVMIIDEGEMTLFPIRQSD